MNLAAWLMFGIWCSLCIVAVLGWLMMTLSRQEKSLYVWEMTEEDKDNVL
tara:strand:- start:410 stop:559 length:150 start_codon:yes stop_codon:yes gene_type:complete